MAQAAWWIEYTADWRQEAPLAYWVHVEQDGRHYHVSEQMSPPAPRPIPHRGYPVLCVDFNGVVLRFTSRAQLMECIRVLSLTPLPTTSRLSALRPTTVGPNGHWLSRLPAKLKSPKARGRLVAVLKRAGESGFDP